MMKATLFLRWLTLLVVIANIVFNGVYDRFFDLPSIGEASKYYNDLFTPSGYVFSIWLLIYLSFLIFSIRQLVPPPRKRRVYAELSLPLIAANVLASLWILAFTSGMLVLSLIIILTMLACAIYMFRKSVHAHFVLKHTAWLPVPFSLFFGWISVAMLANSAVLLTSNGLMDQYITIVFIVLATLAGAGISLKYGNAIYPAVIAWAASGIWAARRVDFPMIATTALFAMVINLVFIVISFIRSHIKKLAVISKPV
jgi:benzodiazapine receptor